MKIPAKIRDSIIKSFRKGEYDIDAIGLTDALEVEAVKKISNALTDMIEDQACKAMDDMASGIVEVILKDLTWSFSNRGWNRGDLVLACSLWEEYWELPINYQSFRFLQYDDEDYGTWIAIDTAIDKLDAIVHVLRKHNAEYQEKHEAKWGKRP